MRLLHELIVLVLMSVTITGCRATDPAAPTGFIEIRIESYPQGWGYAQKTVKPDGSITGGHLSGGQDAPRVYETKSEVTPEDMSKLRALITALQAKSLRTVAPPDQKSEGYKSVILVTGESTAITAYAKWNKGFEPAEIQAIWDLVMKHKVGAW